MTMHRAIQDQDNLRVFHVQGEGIMWAGDTLELYTADGQTRYGVLDIDNDHYGHGGVESIRLETELRPPTET